MKVLLTGASGFVGSHILDSLQAHGIVATILLRPSSDKTFLNLSGVEIRNGSITQRASLLAALDGISHVIHCAGCTRARRYSEFYEINQIGTRNVVEAVNACEGRVQRLIHISSLAVTGPATVSSPAIEESPLCPISEYGKSKLAGEMEVRERCRADFVILRPPAVYGPRDKGFLSMFEAVRYHLLPQPNKKQSLSLVFVKDLAETVARCLEVPATSRQTYFVASAETVTARQMAEEIATQMNRWTVPCPLPAALLWPICLAQEVWSRLSGKPALLNLQKFAELRAPGWVCAPSKLKRELGLECRTALKEGIIQTLGWYQANKWL
jgi:nucleoside-diphosphate-sugar epimerase